MGASAEAADPSWLPGWSNRSKEMGRRGPIGDCDTSCDRVLRPREMDLIAAFGPLLLPPTPAAALTSHGLWTYLGRHAGDGIRPGAAARILAAGLNLAPALCHDKTVDFVSQ